MTNTQVRSSVGGITSNLEEFEHSLDTTDTSHLGEFEHSLDTIDATQVCPPLAKSINVCDYGERAPNEAVGAICTVYMPQLHR